MAKAKRRITIAPSLLSADFSRLGEEMKSMLRAKVRWFHLDIMDGHFVPNLTIGPVVVKWLRKVSPRPFLDAHLMIEEPERYLDAFVEAGAQSVTFHLETVENPRQLLRRIKKLDVAASLSIKPKTHVDEILPYLKDLDMVLVMTVEPGFGGQDFIPSCLNKVRQLKLLKEEKGLNFLIEVDGGINLETAPMVVAAGAEVLVTGNYLFGTRPARRNLLALRRTLESLGNYKVL